MMNKVLIGIVFVVMTAVLSGCVRKETAAVPAQPAPAGGAGSARNTSPVPETPAVSVAPAPSATGSPAAPDTLR